MPFAFGILVVFVPFLIYLLRITDELSLKLDIVNNIAQLVVAASVFLAFISYFESKENDLQKKAVDCVTFFRVEVISLHENMMKLVRDKKGKDFTPYKQMLVTNPTLSNYLAYTKVEYERQSEIFNLVGNDQPTILLLNALEEVSLKILGYGILKHPALHSIINPFVDIVEVSAYQMLFSREISMGLPTYSYILEVYESWKHLVDRTDPKQRIESVLQNIKTERHKSRA
jgi:hypothetical protein